MSIKCIKLAKLILLITTCFKTNLKQIKYCSLFSFTRLVRRLYGVSVCSVLPHAFSSRCAAAWRPGRDLSRACHDLFNMIVKARGLQPSQSHSALIYRIKKRRKKEKNNNKQTKTKLRTKKHRCILHTAP